MTASRSDLSRAGQIAAHTSWAHTPDRTARTAPARAAMLARFELEVDPDGVLPPDERARRAEHAKKAYFLRLAHKSATARRKARELIETAAQADAELGIASDAA